MTTNLLQWLEGNIDGFSYSSAALKTGIAVSSVRRHVTESKKTQSVHETVVAICRAYGLNPIEGLIEAGLVSIEEAEKFADSVDLNDRLSRANADEIIDRIDAHLDELRVRLQPRPLYPGQNIPSRFMRDYSKMSEQDAYDLAAYKGDKNIGHDDLPNEP
jgi:hypothetical protein